MEQTLKLLFKSQEELNKLIEQGYILKQTTKVKYLIKEL